MPLDDAQYGGEPQTATGEFGREGLVSATTEPNTISSSTNQMLTGQFGLSFSYGDSRGNVTVDPAGGGYQYDAENRLVVYCGSSGASCNASSPGAVVYGYDPEGKRITKTDLSGLTVYVYDAAGQLADEYSPTSTTVSTQYLTADMLGSTRLVSDGLGGESERLDYLPYGGWITPTTANGRTCTGAPGNCPSLAAYLGQPGISLQFTGKERDLNLDGSMETGLDYFGFRYYSGAQGRFTSPDAPFADQHPEDPQSWNMYAYVRNNPLKNTDPNGRDCQNGFAACGNYILGGAGAVFNAFTAGIINAPTHIAGQRRSEEARGPAMNPIVSFKEVLSIVGQRLGEKGFRRKGNTFYLLEADNWGIVNFQKSGKSTAEVILLTVNVGVALGVLLRFSGLQSTVVPRIDQCQWRKRLGFFFPDPSDMWWRIDATTCPTALAEEILDGLLTMALPEVKKLMADANLRELWASGESPGLTEVERLKHLSVLLKLADSGPEALDQAKSALQRVSDSRPSAAAIALHLSRLDKVQNV